MRSVEKATHSQTRSFNRQLVLRTIYDHDRMSRADVARTTGLTRTTVSDLVAELIDTGLAEETGRGPSSGGKAPILLRVVEDSRHLIGVDLGESEFRGAVVNLRGEIRGSISEPLGGRDGDEAVRIVYRLIDELIESTDRDILGIGVGTPGLIDTTTGTVRWAVSLDWQDLELGRLLRERYDLPVHVANDSHAATLGEYIFGDDRRAANLVVVNVGRGIGAGLILNGELFQGDAFGAGEIGHTTVVENGAPCRCGKRGCLETVANSRSVIGRATEFAAANPASRLSALIDANPSLTIDLIASAIEAGDAGALEAAADAGRELGRALAAVVGVLNVQRIVLLGSVARLGEPWLAAVRREVSSHALSLLARDTTIDVGSLRTNVVALGASALLMTRELGLAPTR